MLSAAQPAPPAAPGVTPPVDTLRLGSEGDWRPRLAAVTGHVQPRPGDDDDALGLGREAEVDGRFAGQWEDAAPRGSAVERCDECVAARRRARDRDRGPVGGGDAD